MSDVAKELEKIILKAGIDGALTEDAVAQFHALVTERNALRSEKAKLENRIETLDKERAALAGDKAALQTQVNEWATRETELKDREDSVLRKEIEAEFNEKRVADHKEMFKVVFRNSVLRKEVMTPVDQPEPNQYNSCPPAGYPQKDTVEEEET